MASKPSQAVWIKCLACGAVVPALEDAWGVVRPSAKASPMPNAPIRDGYCVAHNGRGR